MLFMGDLNRTVWQSFNPPLSTTGRTSYCKSFARCSWVVSQNAELPFTIIAVKEEVRRLVL